MTSIKLPPPMQAPAMREMFDALACQAAERPKIEAASIFITIDNTMILGPSGQGKSGLRQADERGGIMKALAMGYTVRGQGQKSDSRSLEMDEKIAVERLVQQVKDYANGRAKDVARGAETPRLAALLVQKYGRGVVDAVATVFDNPRSAALIYEVVDEETAKIDPLWEEHNRERWAGRPADVVSVS